MYCYHPAKYLKRLGEHLNTFSLYLDGIPKDDDLQDWVFFAGVDGGHVVQWGVDGPVDPISELPGQALGLFVCELLLHQIPEQLHSKEQ